VLGGIAAATVLFYALRSRSPELRATFEEQDRRDREQIEHGAVLYAAHCAECHGNRLEGQPGWEHRKPDGTYPAPPHDETGHTWHHPDWQLLSIVKLGGQATARANFRSNMPTFGDQLSDDDIRAVLTFIKSRWPPEIRRRQEAANQGRHP